MGTTVTKLLLLEDDAGDARLVQMMLDQAAPGEFTLSIAPRLSDALNLLSKNSFDMVLSDLDLPDSKGLGTFLRLHAQAPGIPVIVVSGLGDEKVAIQAVQAGAQDYLVKGQANGAQLARSIWHGLERHRRRKSYAGIAKKGKVLAFIGAKGGVGTTTVALNVAATLARQNQQVILLELRPYFGSLVLHLRRSVPTANLRHVLNLEPAVLNQREIGARLFLAAQNLRVLFGPQVPGEYGEIDPGQTTSVIEELSGMAEYVVVDLPFIPSAANEACIRRCSYVGVVVDRDAACVAMGKVMLQLLRGLNVDEKRVGAVVVNRVALSHPMTLADVRSGLGCEIVGVIPPAADAHAVAQKAVTPLVTYQAQEIAAIAMAEIAARLAQDPVPCARIG